MQKKIIYVIWRNAHVHGQRLKDNFTKNEKLHKWEKLLKPTTRIHLNGTSLEYSSGSSLKSLKLLHLQLLSTLSIRM